MIESQIPSIPQISGRTSTAITWNYIARRKEIRADVSPSFRAVKKADPYIEIPEKRKENEYMENALAVNSRRDLS